MPDNSPSSYLFAITEETIPIIERIAAIDEALASGEITLEEFDVLLPERMRL